ncbi:MAG: cation transporter [Archaeoglobales archaeon]|nr:MAG: cation transporter [Archaeoglobales archaeon]
MHEIPQEPTLHVALGLAVILLTVLILPFRVRIVEENLEPFFLIMGILSVTVSGLWSFELVKDALKEPIWLPNTPIPIGIFQVVLTAGLIIHTFNLQIYDSIIKLLRRIGIGAFTFFMISFLGLISSLISVIVTAVILSEVASILPIDRRRKIEFVVIACFAVGLGAALTPVGEPLSTIAVSKLKGEPYHADFFFLLNLLGVYVIPGIILLSIYGVYRIGGVRFEYVEIPRYEESLRDVVLRAVRVYIFVSALILLGKGLSPLAVWFFSKVPPEGLYWLNTISAILDNATLVAVEIEPEMSLMQIKSALISLLISGGMLIPGNIPNIVSAGRLKIRMKDWARIGLPIGIVLLAFYFTVLMLEVRLSVCSQ